MTQPDEEAIEPTRPKPRRLLAMVGPGKSWSELTDDEIDQLAKRIHAQMVSRLPAEEELSSK